MGLTRCLSSLLYTVLMILVGPPPSHGQPWACDPVVLEIPISPGNTDPPGGALTLQAKADQPPLDGYTHTG